ncbi:hypothetical protein PAHAL_2G060600 [Panicum hallii]|uniref:Uncharacterized protein n=1 Tax=Panicum hallii TaxID=206008 RepID=A0A2S3GW83_9POAL|nr:hypothetical protein PAHAL_2G060600 [Panicum hallii]
MQGLFCMTPETSEAAGGRARASSGFSFVDLKGGSAAPLDVVDPSFSFLTELPGTRVLLFRDACNGLVLFQHRREPGGGRIVYVVCNPTTKEWEAVPAARLRRPRASNLRLPGLRPGRVRSLPLGPVPGEGRRGVRLGPRLLLRNQDVGWQQDRRTRRARGTGRVASGTQEILDDGEGKYNLSVWALQDYDAQEWVLKGAVNTYEVFGEDSCIDATSEFEVVDIHQDCDVVFFTHPLERSNLVAYDMDSKEVSVIATLGDGKELLGTARYVPCRFS